MIKVGDRFIVKRKGKRCDRSCDAPCLGEWITINNIVLETGIVEVLYDCDGEHCSKFNISDFEEIKKVIKQYGIVNFINNLNLKGGTNV